MKENVKPVRNELPAAVTSSTSPVGTVPQWNSSPSPYTFNAIELDIPTPFIGN